MKKVTSVFLLLLFLAFAWTSSAQVSGYTFTKTTGAYTEITGGTSLGSETVDDQRFVDPAVPAGGTTTTGVGFPIGFSFTFDGVAFDRLAINANGWISLGQSSLTPSVNNSSTSAYTPIGSLVVITPDLLVSRIVGLGRDLQAQVGATLRLETVGAAPNRICVIQWKNYKKYGTTGTGDSYNFQIKLYETTNVVEYVYGTMTNNATSTTVQVGLRGAPSATATNFANRSTTTDWNATIAGTLNTASCTLSNTVFPASGTTFSFTPPVVSAPGLPSNPVPANLATNVAINGNLTWNFGANTETYDLWFGPTGAAVKVVTNAVAGATGSYAYSGLTNLTGYEWHVVARNSNAKLETVGETWTFTTVTAAPLAVTNPVPATGAANVPWAGQLGWTFGANTETYDLYFGAPGAMVKVVDNAVAGATGTYGYSGLSANTLYNWQVISRNSVADLVTDGPIWTFTTACAAFPMPYFEDFSTTTAGTIPGCWTPSGLGLTNWKASATALAGGTANELMLSWTPSFTGVSMMISPAINTTGLTSVAIQFKHMFDYYAVPFTFGLKTSGDGTNWSTVWSVVDPIANVGPETKTLTAGVADGVGSGTFYIAFYVDGYTFNIDNWYMDDVSVFSAVYGNLDGYVYRFGTTNPIEGATVSFGANSTTTNASGYYSFTDVLAGTYNVTATATGYNAQTVNGVVVSAGSTTSQNFGLTWANITVVPGVISVSLEPNSLLTETVTISNPGGTAPLNWNAALVFPSDNAVGSGNVSFEYEKKYSNNASPNAEESPDRAIMKGDLTDATWDVLSSWSTHSASEQAVSTDGEYFYTTKWNGTGNFSKYTLAGVWVEDFVIATAAAIRDLTYDGTYFYGGAGAATIYILDLANKVQVGTITASTVGGVRHISYDPTVDGFWCGNWTTLHRINRTGTVINSGPVVANVYGSAYDPYTSGGPFLWLFAQNATAGCGTADDLVTLQQFSISTLALTGVVHCATDIPGYIPGAVGAQTIAGGACSSDLLFPGKFVLIANVQQTNNLIGVYELATLENWVSLDPGSGSVEPDQQQVLNVNFDSEGLEDITKTCDIKITSNALNGAKTITTIPVTMVVQPALTPPDAPTNLTPVNNATMVALQPTFTWTNGARTSQVKVTITKGLAVAYESAFFTGSSLNLAAVPFTLDPKTVYKWRVTAKNAAGSILGPQWTFTTIGKGTIAGTVTDAYDNSPIEGATVTVDAASKVTALTGADGTYSISDLLEGAYVVSVTHPDYNAPAPANATVTHNATTTVNFQMNVILDPPRNLAAEIMNNYDVQLNWDAPGGFDPTYIHWDDGTFFTRIGTNSAANFDVAARFTPADLVDYAGGSITKINFVPGEADAVCIYTVKVWQGVNPPTLIYSELVPSTTTLAWNEFTLATPVPFDNTQELWIGYNCNTTAGYPAGADNGPAITGFGDMLDLGSGFVSMNTTYALNYNWNIQAYLVSAKGASLITPPAKINSNVALSGGTPVAVTVPEANRVTFTNVTENGVKAPTGYNVYRDAVKIADNIAELTYNDLGLEPAVYSYEVSAQYPQGESDKIGPLEVTILLGGFVEGYVYDVYDNTPIEGALIENLVAEYSTTTNAAGYYKLALPVGSWDIAASDVGYQTMVSYGMEIIANETIFNDYALEIAAPVLTDVYQSGMDVVALWTGNPIFELAKDKASVQMLTTDVQPMEKKSTSGKPKYVTPGGVKQGGDVIATAVPINTFPALLTGTTDGYTDDYDAVCPYTSPGGPDVVYSYIPAANQSVNVGLCNSSYDTKLYIFDADGVTLIACNDDICGNDGYKSQVSNIALIGGNTYYIIVDGYDDTSYGEYELILEEYIACNIDCDPNAIAEGEECAGDDYVDNFNGGCNSVPPVFSTINSGDIICGTASTFIVDGTSNSRDTDWYIYVNETPKQVTFSGTAEFPLQLLLVGDDGNCATYIPAFATAPACETATFTYNIAPGTWYFWVGPSAYEGVPCAEYGNEYEVQLTAVDIFMPFYHVFRTDTKALVATTYNTYYVDENVALGGTYCYQVSEVVDDLGRETGLSNEMCYTVTCPAPTNLSAIVTGTSADLSWTPGAVETTWNLEWGVAGFIQGAGTLVTGTTSNPYTISSLSEGVSYSFYVQADCGGGYVSTWAGPYTFAVPCSPKTLPFMEDFTGVATGTMPSCWSVSGLGLTNWSVQPTANAGGVSPEMRLNWSPSFTGESMLVSSSINTTGYTTLSMNFKHFLDWYSNSVIIGVKTSADGVTWNEVWSEVAAANVGPQDVSITLNNTDVGSPTFQVAFFINGYTFDIDYWYIDNLSITAPITCPAPGAAVPTALNITGTTADIQWTENGAATQWNIEYGPFGFSQGTGITQVATTNPWPISGLTSSSSYSFYVQSDCGGGDLSFWSGPYTFMTACEAFAVPFSEGFEGLFPPTCWTNLDWLQSFYGEPHTGLEWAYSNLAGSELITPEIAIPAGDPYQLSFWYAAESSNYPQDMDVLISTDGTIWTILESFVGIVNMDYIQAVYSLEAYAGQSVWVKFNGLTGEGGYDYGVLVDDVLIDLIPPPQQTVVLPEGWSGWSSYIDPMTDAAFTDVIAPVAANMIFSQYFSSVYWPAYGINTMGAFSNAHGYVSKMSLESSLTLVGTLLAPGTINLASGWNLISVLSECDVDATLLGSVPGFEICMEVAGAGVYWPTGGITSLTTLVPGKAYWVRMSAAGSFTYPICAKDAGKSAQLPIRPAYATPWNTVNFTGTTHFIAVSAEAARSLETGDVLGVFNAEGVCSGMIQMNGNATTLNVFGDDATTTELDGMAEGSAMIFKVYRAATGEIFDVTVNYGVDMPDYNGTFTTLGMSRIAGMTLNATGAGSLNGAQISIFPNPSTGIFNITMNGVEGNVEMQVIDAHGQSVYTASISGTTRIDLTKQPKGVYYVKLIGSSFTSIEKVVIK